MKLSVTLSVQRLWPDRNRIRRKKLKRSEINREVKKAEQFFRKQGFNLPPWLSREPKEWKNVDRASVEEIVRNRLGWDVTDMGSGDFLKRGLVLITIRNGGPANTIKPYAEKLMLVQEDQETALHYHASKIEDIINRGGGILVLELFYHDENAELTDEPITVSIDGVRKVFKPGEKVRLMPGESICLEQGVFHRFYAETGSGMVMAGEVSAVNDDETDNYFYEKLPRYPAIEEDEEPYRVLCNEYEKFI